MSPIPASPDILVIGGGPAGLAAGRSAAEAGATVVVAERDGRLGGILNQCVHDGFGLRMFGESLTGPECAARLVDDLARTDARTLTDSIVLSFDAERSCRLLTRDGYQVLTPRAVVLALGCRERSFGSLAVPGARPAGIYSAGTAQRLINLDGLMVGSRAVILGSGDVGLIMARRMVLEGAEVVCVVEQLPFAGGLARNVSQCLNDFGIPLLLRHTVVEVIGNGRVSAVAIAEVGEDGKPVPESREVIACDTLLVSVGLIPENELTREAGASVDRSTGGALVDQRLMTSIPGVFACGNGLHVHDLADWASLEGEVAGASAAAYARAPWESGPKIAVTASEDFRYVVPQWLAPGLPARLSFRVTRPRRRTRVVVEADGSEILTSEFAQVTPSILEEIALPSLPAGTGRLEVRVG